jgi:hypothetical protein
MYKIGTSLPQYNLLLCDFLKNLLIYLKANITLQGHMFGFAAVKNNRKEETECQNSQEKKIAQINATKMLP